MEVRANGRYWLAILTSCFVFGCLGYVELFRTMTDRVADPDTQEFWQVRTIALRYRNPEMEARQAVATGNFKALEFIDILPAEEFQCHQVHAENGTNPFRQASLTTTLVTDGPEELSDEKALRDFENAGREFAARYNSELVRLVNQ